LIVTITRDEIRWDGDPRPMPMPPELPMRHWISDRRLNRMLHPRRSLKEYWRDWRRRHRANRRLLWALDFTRANGGHSWFLMTPFFQLTVWNHSATYMHFRRGLFTGYELRWYFNDGVLSRETGEWIFIRSRRSLDIVGPTDALFFGHPVERTLEHS
jgi:hypothetical protein